MEDIEFYLRCYSNIVGNLVELSSVVSNPSFFVGLLCVLQDHMDRLLASFEELS